MNISQAPPNPPPSRLAGVTLHNVDWETYRRLRNEPADWRLRMTYDQGTLEIMSPGRLHERIAELIGQCIVDWALGRGIPISPGGALSVSREDLQRGAEPDKCYFIRHEQDVRGSDSYSLDENDPPPDLVVEIDVGSSSIPRMPIYAAIGVPEVWRWRNETIQVFLRDADGQFILRQTSEALSDFPFGEVARLIEQRRERPFNELVQEFREFVQSGKSAASDS